MNSGFIYSVQIILEAVLYYSVQTADIVYFYR